MVHRPRRRSTCEEARIDGLGDLVAPLPPWHWLTSHRPTGRSCRDHDWPDLARYGRCDEQGPGQWVNPADRIKSGTKRGLRNRPAKGVLTGGLADPVEFGSAAMIRSPRLRPLFGRACGFLVNGGTRSEGVTLAAHRGTQIHRRLLKHSNSLRFPSVSIEEPLLELWSEHSRIRRSK